MDMVAILNLEVKIVPNLKTTIFIGFVILKIVEFDVMQLYILLSSKVFVDQGFFLNYNSGHLCEVRVVRSDEILKGDGEALRCEGDALKGGRTKRR